MLLKWRSFLNKKKLILGSSSQERRKLFDELQINYSIIKSNFPEDLPKTDPKSYVEETCYNKLLSIVKDNANSDIDILITADTILTVDNKILEKAENEDEAFSWIMSYSEKEVLGISACCIALIRKRKRDVGDNEKDSTGLDKVNYVHDIIKFTEMTKIKMIRMNEDIVKEYIKTGDWKNRAGAIGVSSVGKLLVEKIDGCFYNVVGLSISALSKNIDIILNRNYNKEDSDNKKS